MRSRSTFSAWAVQMNVSVFSSMMLKRLAGVRIDVDDPQPLVAAVDLFIGEVPAVAIPRNTWKVEVNLVDVRS